MLVKKQGWVNEQTDAEKTLAEGKNWKTDSSGGIIRVVMKNHGCHPFGNAKARAVVWNFPDAIPQHREPIYGTRPDLVAKYPTHDDKKAFWRLPTLYKSLQDKNVADKVYEKFPLIMSSGRLVEYEGGGEETRSNPWLAQLQQEAFVEINPKTAADRGIRNGERVWLSSPTGARLNVQALVTERVAPDTVWMPFHFSGRWQGADMLAHYPKGAAPIVRGEAVNTATTYGYDSVTMMQETKTTICNVERLERTALTRRQNNGTNEIHLRCRALHRMQRLRYRLQERARGAVGREPPPRGHPQRRCSRREVHLGGLHALQRRALHGSLPRELLLPHGRRRGAACQGCLHRLRLLQLRLPVWRTPVPVARHVRRARQDGQVHLLRRWPRGQWQPGRV